METTRITARRIHPIPKQLSNVSLPLKTNIETPKAVRGSNAPIILAGVEPIICMLCVTITKERKVVNTAKPNELPQELMVFKGVRFIPKPNMIKKNITPDKIA